MVQYLFIILLKISYLLNIKTCFNLIKKKKDVLICIRIFIKNMS